MSHDFLCRLKDGILVADGAMGTMLQGRGLGAGECPEEWNLSHVEEVKAIHEAYLRAGCHVILTNTFGGNRLKLHRFGLEDKVHEINRAGAKIAREAISQDIPSPCPLPSGERSPKATRRGEIKGEGNLYNQVSGTYPYVRPLFVLGDVGPTGEFMEPAGSLKWKEFYQVFKEQVLALVEGGVDAIIVETMSSLEECQAAVRAAKENTNLPVIASLSFNPGERGFRTMMGVDIPTAVKGLTECGADVIGTNCGGISIDEMAEVITKMRDLTGKPLISQPNAGRPALVDGKTVYNESPETMATQVRKLVKAGANIIGGCCGTTPQHMAKIVQILSIDKHR